MSACGHENENGGEALARTPADVDPTRTKTTRKRYAQKLRAGFSKINTEVRRGVRDRDVFGLDVGSDALAERVPSFRFTTDDQKTEEFLRWLRQQQEQDVLRTISTDRNTWVDSAYRRGVQHADTTARQAGVDVPANSLEVTLRQPVHRDTLQLLYTRNFEALDGITSEVSRQVGRELTQGFAEGVGPEDMARRITDRVDSIGRTRATVLARTETINAHSTATLERYDELGVEEVGVKAEFMTAGDLRVCPECASLDGEVFTVKEARGIIPVHPSCRCAWVPVASSN